MCDNSTFDEAWWQRTWQERMDRAVEMFGEFGIPGERPGTVYSAPFSLTETPGACVLVFPPTLEPNHMSRPDWLYMTLGLSQPLTNSQTPDNPDIETLSGYGAEFAVVVPEPTDWAPQVLFWLMRYVHAERPISAGDRLECTFHEAESGQLVWTPLPIHERQRTPASQTAACIFWPLLFPHSTLSTSTGEFDVVAVTNITGTEYKYAEKTTSAHLLLLLARSGVWQRCLPTRKSVTRTLQWSQEWQRIQKLSVETVLSELNENIGKWHLAGETT